MSHCDKYIEMASLYIDGELPENEVPELMEHLAGCPDCRRYYEVFSGVSDALSDEVKAPEGFAAAVMDAVGAAAAPKKAVKPRRRGLVAKYAAMAACLALVIAAGVRLASPPPTGLRTARMSPPPTTPPAASRRSPRKGIRSCMARMRTPQWSRPT